MAVSIVRELKQADIVEGGQTSNSLRSWLMFDPLAAEATFPGTPSYFPRLTDSGLPCGDSTDGVGDGQTYDYSVAYPMFLWSCVCRIWRILALESRHCFGYASLLRYYTDVDRRQK